MDEYDKNDDKEIKHLAQLILTRLGYSRSDLQLVSHLVDLLNIEDITNSYNDALTSYERFYERLESL